MIIEIGRPKQKKSEPAKRPYQPELGGFAAAEYYGRRLPSTLVAKTDVVGPPRRRTDKPQSKPELGGFAAA